MLDKTFLLEILETLAMPNADGVAIRKEGICANVWAYYEGMEARNWILSAATDWDKHSGNRFFPIPSDYFLTSDPQECYEESRDIMWDFDSVYGGLRKELLDFLIQSLKEEIKNDV